MVLKTRPRHLLRFAALLTLLPAIALWQVAHVQAAPQSAQALNIQGKLTAADGEPVSSSVTIRVRLFDAPSSGVLLYDEDHQVTPENGFYSLSVGQGSSLGGGSENSAADAIRKGGSVWFSIEVDNDGEMLPRTELLADAFALNANSLQGKRYISDTSASGVPSTFLNPEAGDLWFDETNGQLFFFDGLDWQPASGSSSGSFLPLDGSLSMAGDLNLGSNDLTDVGHINTQSISSQTYTGDGSGLSNLSVSSLQTSTSAFQGDILRFNGSVWENQPLAVAPIDIDPTGASIGQVLGFDGAHWGAQNIILDPSNLSSLGASPNAVLRFNDQISSWEPQNLVVALNELEVGSATAGQVLTFDGLGWIPQTLSGSGLASVTDLPASGAASGDIIRFNGSSWNTEILHVTPADFDITNASADDVFRFNGSGWEIAPLNVGLSNLDSAGAIGGQVVRFNGSAWAAENLSVTPADLDITNASADDVFRFNGSSWEIAPLNVGLSNLDSAGAIGGQVVRFNGSAWAAENLSVTPADLDITNASADDIFRFNGSGWEIAPLNVGLSNLDTVGASNGQIIRFNGSTWGIENLNVTPDDLDTFGATIGDILRFNGSTWDFESLSVGPDDIAQGTAVDGDILVFNTQTGTWDPQTPSAASSPWTSLGTDLFFDTGRVGVGTNTVNGIFHAATDTPLAEPVLFQGASSATGDASTLILQRSRGTTSNPSSVFSGDAIMRFVAEGYDGFNFAEGVSIDAFAAGNWDNTSHATSLSFLTTDLGQTVPSTRMTIAHDGKVGIGAITPAVALDINATDAVQLPAGPDADRPAVADAGMIRWNTSTQILEAYDGLNWFDLGSGGSGGGLPINAPAVSVSNLLTANGFLYEFESTDTSSQGGGLKVETFSDAIEAAAVKGIANSATTGERYGVLGEVNSVDGVGVFGRGTQGGAIGIKGSSNVLSPTEDNFGGFFSASDGTSNYGVASFVGNLQSTPLLAGDYAFYGESTTGDITALFKNRNTTGLHTTGILGEAVESIPTAGSTRTGGAFFASGGEDTNYGVTGLADDLLASAAQVHIGGEFVSYGAIEVNYGVVGRVGAGIPVQSEGDTGVLGEALLPGAYGGCFTSIPDAAGDAFGVMGRADVFSTGKGIAVQGEATSFNATLNVGVQGIADNAINDGESRNYGIRGLVGNTTFLNDSGAYAVYGRSESADGFGGFFHANSGGTSPTFDVGVAGVADNTNSMATNIAIDGRAHSAGVANYGVLGLAGFASSPSLTTGDFGVYGEATLSTGYGIFGLNGATGGIGIKGVSDSGGIGVKAVVDLTGGEALFAERADASTDTFSEIIATFSVAGTDKASIRGDGSIVQSDTGTFVSTPGTGTVTTNELVGPLSRIMRIDTTGGSVTINNIASTDAPEDGQELYLLVQGSSGVVINDSGNINLMSGGSSVTINAGDIMHFIYDSAEWVEVSHSDN